MVVGGVVEVITGTVVGGIVVVITGAAGGNVVGAGTSVAGVVVRGCFGDVVTVSNVVRTETEALGVDMYTTPSR
jgi:hypothetical protein